MVHSQLRSRIGAAIRPMPCPAASGIVALTLANFPLGLVVTGLESLMVLGEVHARRSAWVRYEDSLFGSEASEPGAHVRLENGMRVPLTAKVIEGTGTATHGSGLPVPLTPGALAPAGAILTGGPFVLELQAGDAFEPEPRPLARPLTFFDRYVNSANLLSLALALVNGVRLQSWAHAFEAMLLLNPRPAVIGREVANLGAAAGRCGGMTVVGTRPDRPLQLPHVLLLDGPRMLTDGLEVTGLLPLTPGVTDEGLQTLAAQINAAAGSPWGLAFPPAAIGPGQECGLQRLVGRGHRPWRALHPGPARRRRGRKLPAAARRRLSSGTGQGRALSIIGLLALRPRLARGVDELVTTCRRFGVSVEMLPSGSPAAAHFIGRRAGICVLPAADMVETIRTASNASALAWRWYRTMPRRAPVSRPAIWPWPWPVPAAAISRPGPTSSPPICVP